MQVQPTAARPMPVAPRESDKPLRDAAKKLEAGFIAEMLKSAGFGKSRNSFGGGAGEDGFSSFLVNEQAQKIADSGGFGLAEHIFQALQGRENPDV